MFNPPHPGEILREEYLIPLNLTVTDFAKKLGVSRKNLSTILNEKTGISAEMAIRLSKSLNTTPELWIGMQMEYELALAMKKEKDLKVEKVH
ncbi:MAG: HigA family addiction module antitoxin [Cyclobacteriaceae bacterium]